MRSNTKGSVVMWLLSQVNWGFFLGPKGLAMIILAIGGVAVWLSVGGEDQGRELISLSRPWMGQSDNRAEVSVQDQTILTPEFLSENEGFDSTDDQLVDQLRTLPAVDIQTQPQSQHQHQTQTHKQHDGDKWVTVRMRVTGYCACSKCCGEEDGITANMHRIRPGDVLVAADKKFRFGTQMMIPGYNAGQPVKVMDRGRVIQGNRLDLFFHNHAEAKRFGVKYLNVRVKVS
jgi:3D (Asp-Asp-Asp) domain-containing protein